MSDRQEPHLQDDDLLPLLDGEQPERDAADIRAHVEACWTCRTRMDEMKNTIGEYVRYRDTVRTLAPPPASWGDLEPALARIDRSLTPPPSPVLRRSFLALRPAYWVAAAAMVLLLIVVRRLEVVPPVSAAELLRKASAAEQKPTARRRIQIKTRHRQFTRPASLPVRAASEPDDLEQLFNRAHFNWDDPLSARSFAAWHDQLTGKQDDVPARDNFTYKIHTSTTASELHEATLILRAQDLQPLSETLQFASDTVEITTAPDAATPSEIAAAPAPERVPARDTTKPVELPSPIHRELQVFSALHEIGADLGEPVEMNPDGSRLIVTGTGLTNAQKQQLRAALQDIVGIEIRFEDATPSTRAGATPGERATSATAPLQQRLQTLLGSRETVEDFTNRALDASDAMMARAHALRALDKAFPPAVESGLASGDRELLDKLRRDHAIAFAAKVHELRAVLDPVLSNFRAPTPSAPTGSLFSAAQNLDQLLNRALAGSTADAQDVDFQRIAAALDQVERIGKTTP